MAQPEPLRKLNEVLHDHNLVLKKQHQRLITANEELFIKANGILNEDGADDPIGICCKGTRCSTALESVCSYAGGTFTPLIGGGAATPLLGHIRLDGPGGTPPVLGVIRLDSPVNEPRSPNVGNGKRAPSKKAAKKKEVTD
jgi:hypothetical protein